MPWTRWMLMIAALAVSRLAAAQVSVLDPWVRGTVEGQSATAAYMTVRSTAAVRLVKVTSPSAARCSLHQMTMQGNVMRMRTLDSLPISAGGSVALQEGHDHLMLEGLQHPLKEGDTVRLTVTFVDSKDQPQTVSVDAPVRPLGVSSP